MNLNSARIDAVHIVQRMAPGGIETLVLDLLRAQNRSVVFSLESTAKELTAAWPALASESNRLEAFDHKPHFSPGLIFSIAQRLRQLKPTAVVAHHIGPLLYGGAAARLAFVPKLIHVEHDVWHYQNPHNQRIAKLCGAVLRPSHIAVSQQAADYMHTIFPGRSITVIPPGIDTVRFAPMDRSIARTRLGLDSGATLIGTVGRLVPVKSQSTLISALRHLPNSIHAVLVGEGPELGALVGLAHRYKLSHRVHFLGHRDDIEHVLPAFDVFCLPSLNEGLPRSVLEAQSCGLPVVASNVGGLRDAICPVNGRLVAPADAEAVAAAILDLLKQGMREPGPRAFVEQHFSLTATRDAYRAISD